MANTTADLHRTDSPNLHDSELLMQFSRYRQADAFARLVERHGPMVLGVCGKILRHSQDTEDAFQAVFLVLAQSADKISRANSVGPWLHRVAYRTAMRMAKRRHDRNTQHIDQADIPATGEWCGIAEQEQTMVLHQELCKLPEIYRSVLVLHYLEGKSCSSAADELDCTDEVVKTRLSRGRRMLRMRLLRRGLALTVVLTAMNISRQSLGAEPTLFSSTAEVCSQVVLHGSRTGLSSNVCQLAKEGATGMSTIKLSITCAAILLLGVAGVSVRAGSDSKSPQSKGDTIIEASESVDAGIPFPTVDVQMSDMDPNLGVEEQFTSNENPRGGSAAGSAASPNPPQVIPIPPLDSKLIIQELGRIGGADFQFIIFKDLTWRYVDRSPVVNKQGKFSQSEYDAFIEELNKAGLGKTKTQRPTPALYSQIRTAGDVIGVVLPRDHKLMQAVDKQLKPLRSSEIGEPIEPVVREVQVSKPRYRLLVQENLNGKAAPDFQFFVRNDLTWTFTDGTTNPGITRRGKFATETEFAALMTELKQAGFSGNQTPRPAGPPPFSTITTNVGKTIHVSPRGKIMSTVRKHLEKLR